MPSPSKTPVLVLSLIFTMLVLSVGSIALIVLFNANRPDSVAIAAACKNEVGAAIKAESDKVAKACEDKEPLVRLKTVEGNKNHPGFKYPENLQVNGRIENQLDENGARFFIGMYPNPPIFECSECDGGPTTSIRITKTPPAVLFKPNETLESHILANYSINGTTYRNIVIKQETLNGQEATVVTFEFDSDFFGEKNIKGEHIFVQKGTSVVEAVYSQYENTSFIDYIEPSVWQIVRSSLDFSKIE